MPTTPKPEDQNLKSWRIWAAERGYLKHFGADIAGNEFLAEAFKRLHRATAIPDETLVGDPAGFGPRAIPPAKPEDGDGRTQHAPETMPDTALHPKRVSDALLGPMSWIAR